MTPTDRASRVEVETKTVVAPAENWPVEKCSTCGFADRWDEFNSAVLRCSNCGSMVHVEDDARERMLTASHLTSLPLSALPAGWRLVPVEPTDKMIMDGAELLFMDDFDWDDAGAEAATQTYAAMLSAAPEPPKALALARLVDEAVKVVNEQASDERLWFEPEYLTEDILQKALRRLHAAIEGVSPEESALIALRDGGK